MGSTGSLAVFLFLQWGALPVQAAQDAEVKGPEAQIHQYANPSSPALVTLRQGEHLRISDRPVRQPSGEWWYRARVTDKQVGYISADAIVPASVQQAIRQGGIEGGVANSSTSRARIDGALREEWAHSLRFAGVWSGELRGETELALGLGSVAGSVPRRFALGPVVSTTRGGRFVGGSALIRLFTEERLEQEMRLRLGVENGVWHAQALAGLRLPLATDTSHLHVAGYFDFGLDHALASVDHPSSLFALMGVGVLF